MRTKSFRNGASLRCRSYIKNVGKGYEVGFIFGGKPIFLGNFIKSNEANTFYGQLNKDIRTFSKKFRVGKNCPKTWYGKFLGNHLHRRYYSFINRVVPTNNRTAQRGFNKSLREYKRLNRRWTPSQKAVFLKAA